MHMSQLGVSVRSHLNCHVSCGGFASVAYHSLYCTTLYTGQLGSFADGFIAVLLADGIAPGQESAPHPPRNFSLSVLKLIDRDNLRRLNQEFRFLRLPPIDPQVGVEFISLKKTPKSDSFSSCCDDHDVFYLREGEGGV